MHKNRQETRKEINLTYFTTRNVLQFFKAIRKNISIFTKNAYDRRMGLTFQLPNRHF